MIDMGYAIGGSSMVSGGPWARVDRLAPSVFTNAACADSSREARAVVESWVMGAFACRVRWVSDKRPGAFADETHWTLLIDSTTWNVAMVQAALGQRCLHFIEARL